MTALLVVLLACFQQGGHDLIIRNDGRQHKGRILSESAQQVVFEVIITGSKGQTLGTGKLTILKKDIREIKRATVEARAKATARAEAFTNRSQRYVEAMAKIDARPITLEGASGYQIAGTQYVLYSTCDEAFAKDAAYSLEEIFAAYRKFFKIRRNADQKVAVYLFSDRREYDGFQVRTLGAAVPNLAYYDPKKNYVAAYNMIQKEEERKIRQKILELEKEIARFRSAVVDEQRRVDKRVRELKQELANAVSRAKSAIRRDGRGAKTERLREIDRQKKQQLEILAQQEKQYRAELAQYRKDATEAIEKNRKVIDGNRKVLRSQNREMFETLFHESFHAFATNYLWEGSARREFPRWLHEGMASYFETSVVEAGELIHGAPDPDRLRTVRGAMSGSGAYGWLKKLIEEGTKQFAISHAGQLKRVSVAYAQSWALSHYITGRVSREKLEAYLAEILAGKEPVPAFERMMGKSWRLVERDIQDHINQLP